MFTEENKNNSRSTDINICFISDENYVKPMGIAITSILLNKLPTDNLNIYILYRRISDRDINKIKKLKKIAPFNVQFIRVSTALVSRLSVKELHVTSSTYYKLFFSSLLPKHIEKLIYLDCDVVVNCSLAKLMNENMDEYFVKGVSDISYRSFSKMLGVGKYINAGILLIDLKKWRENNIEEKFMDCALRYGNIKNFHEDQGCVNLILSGKIDFFDDRWNVQLINTSGKYYSKSWGIQDRVDYFKSLAPQAYIIHFLGGEKPWNFLINENEKYYFRYAIKSPWKIKQFFVHIFNIFANLFF